MSSLSDVIEKLKTKPIGARIVFGTSSEGTVFVRYETGKKETVVMLTKQDESRAAEAALALMDPPAASP